MKVQGITNLPGFLSSSRELVILWDELFFTRLWCVYEVAVYGARNPIGRIRLLPMELTATLAVIHLFYFACTFLLACFLASTPLYALCARAGDAYEKQTYS